MPDETLPPDQHWQLDRVGVDMVARHPPSCPEGPICPRCSALDGTLSLLTSMTRYYVCRHCACRWQISRIEEE